MQRMLVVITSISLALVSPATAQDDAKGLVVRADPQNVVASTLIGTWALDDVLNQRLGHKGGPARLEFRIDPTVLAKVPAGIAKKLADFRIFAAGTMVKGDTEHAFLLTERSGNADLIWFRERNGDPLGDAESWFVAAARAEERASDLLFVGGDHNNQGFAAYKRVTAQLAPAAAITEMIRMFEAGKHLEFIETYCSPEDLAELAGMGRTPAQLATRFEGERGEEFLAMLTAIEKVPPTMSESGDEASWKVDIGPGTLRLQLVDGRWYLRNR